MYPLPMGSVNGKWTTFFCSPIFLLRHHRPLDLLKVMEKEKVHHPIFHGEDLVHPIDSQPSFNLNSWMALGVPGLDLFLKC